MKETKNVCCKSYFFLICLFLVASMFLFLGLVLGVFYAGPNVFVGDFIEFKKAPDGSISPILGYTEAKILPTRTIDADGKTRFLLELEPKIILRNRGAISLTFGSESAIPFYITQDHGVKYISGSSTRRLHKINGLGRNQEFNNQEVDELEMGKKSSLGENIESGKLCTKVSVLEEHQSSMKSSSLEKGENNHKQKGITNVESSDLRHLDELEFKSLKALNQQGKQPKLSGSMVGFDVRSGELPQFHSYSNIQFITPEKFDRSFRVSSLLGKFPLQYWIFANDENEPKQATFKNVSVPASSAIESSVYIKINTTVADGTTFLSNVDQDCRTRGQLRGGVMFLEPYSTMFNGLLHIEFSHKVVMETQFRIKCSQLETI